MSIVDQSELVAALSEAKATRLAARKEYERLHALASMAEQALWDAEQAFDRVHKELLNSI